MYPQIVTFAEIKNSTFRNFSKSVLGLHVPDSAPVGGKEVSSDEETDEVTDHDDTDDEVVVEEFRSEDENYIWIKLSTQEACIFAHIRQYSITRSISIYQSCH